MNNADEIKKASEIVKALRCCGNVDTKKPDCEHCPMLSTRMCVKVMLEGAADLIESLQAQLAASQRRERAAVADIKHKDNCDVCKFSKYDGGCDDSDFDCETCKNACPCATCRNESNWQWRGPQEAGNGKTE